MRNLPSISIIIPTFNSERTLKLCLGRLKKQKYDHKKIELITVDGGSTDSTLTIAKSFHSKIIKVGEDKQNAEYNKGVGLKHAKNEIVLFLDHDNIMPHNEWLLNIINPFVEDKEIVGVEPLRFHYKKTMTLLDRYFALFGGSDPVVYYLGKNSHLSWAESDNIPWGKSEDFGSYIKVKFFQNKIPALGGNGAAIRRRELIKYAKVDPEHFFHTDVVADLIRNKHPYYGMAKETIMHLTNNKVLPFLARRKYFIEKYQLQDEYKRRYHVYDPGKDKAKLMKYVFFSVTFVVPLKDSIMGYLKIRDIAWFLHPFMCLAFLTIYCIPVIKGGVKNVLLGK